MTDDKESKAKARFITLAALRLFGVAMIMAGFALIAGKLDLGDNEMNRIVGAILVLVGAFDFAVVPMLLARSWNREKR